MTLEINVFKMNGHIILNGTVVEHEEDEEEEEEEEEDNREFAAADIENEENDLLLRDDREDSVNDDVEENRVEGKLFDPPLYRQRYEAVLDILSDERWTYAMSRVVDFGCAECKFVNMLRRLPYVREIVGVDLDDDLLQECRRRTEPLFVDYLEPRKYTAVDTHLMCGSVGQYDCRLKDTDAVTAIELVEHLYPYTLSEFPATVFGCMKPKLVVVTTPNQEYNVLFPDFQGPFRHFDHKFEWTRDQFDEWAQEIVHKYPDYLIERISGVGGDESGQFGYCSQLAVFVRKDFYCDANNGKFAQISLEDDDTQASSRQYVLCQSGEEDEEEPGPYSVIISHKFPVRRDFRTREVKIFEEAKYYMEMLAQGTDSWYDEQDSCVALDKLMGFSRIQAHDVTQDELRNILTQNDYEVTTDIMDGLCVIVPFVPASQSSDEEEDYNINNIPPTQQQGGNDINTAGEEEEEDEEWD